MVQSFKKTISSSYPYNSHAYKRNDQNFVGGVIPYQADIGEGTVIGYQGIGVVIHKKCVIGTNCHISQNVTLGGGGGPDGGLPILGDNVLLGAGAVILGNVHIGNNAKIGANSVVLSDIPENAVAVGAPARVVKIIES